MSKLNISVFSIVLCAMFGIFQFCTHGLYASIIAGQIIYEKAVDLIEIDLLLVDYKTGNIIPFENMIYDDGSFTFQNIEPGKYGLVARQYLNPDNPYDYIEKIIENIVLLPNRRLSLGQLHLEFPKGIDRLARIADTYRNFTSEDISPYTSLEIHSFYEAIPYGPDAQQNNNEPKIHLNTEPVNTRSQDPNPKGLTPYDY